MLSKQDEQSNGEYEDIKYPCSFCEYAAKKKGNLKKHIQSKHENSSYNCQLCSYVTNTKWNLINHKKPEHSNIRYPCELSSSGPGITLSMSTVKFN